MGDQDGGGESRDEIVAVLREQLGGASNIRVICDIMQYMARADEVDVDVRDLPQGLLGVK